MNSNSVKHLNVYDNEVFLRHVELVWNIQHEDSNSESEVQILNLGVMNQGIFKRTVISENVNSSS